MSIKYDCSDEKEFSFVGRMIKAVNAFEGIDEIPEAGAVKELVEAAREAVEARKTIWSDGPSPTRAAMDRVEIALAKFGGAKNATK